MSIVATGISKRFGDFVALDNVSDPKANIGAEQLAWLAADLKKLKPDQPIVVFTHRPLFDLAPSWDWVRRGPGPLARCSGSVSQYAW